MDIYVVKMASGDTKLYELGFDEDHGYWRFVDLGSDTILWRPYHAKDEALERLERHKKFGNIKEYYKYDGK